MVGKNEKRCEMEMHYDLDVLIYYWGNTYVAI